MAKVNFTASVWEQQGWVLHEPNVWSEEQGTAREHKTDAPSHTYDVPNPPMQFKYFQPYKVRLKPKTMTVQRTKQVEVKYIDFNYFLVSVYKTMYVYFPPSVGEFGCI